MARSGRKLAKTKASAVMVGYEDLFADIARVIEDARLAAARSVNTVMTATYWLVGRRIVEQEQGGKARAGYGEALLGRLSADLTARFGRGFSVDRLEIMRLFFQTYPDPGSEKSVTLSRKSNSATLSRELGAAKVEPTSAAINGSGWARALVSTTASATAPTSARGSRRA
jgi:hypothetical protein